MGFCLPFKSRKSIQNDNRLNFHDPPTPSRHARSSSRNSRSDLRPHSLVRKGSTVGSTISKVRSNSRTRDLNPTPPFRRRSSLFNPTPPLPGKDMRPAGLFADVKPPLVGTQPQRPHRSRKKPSEAIVVAGSPEDDRGRGRVPNNDKANKVLGRDPDPAISYHRMMTQISRNSHGNDLEKKWTSVAPRPATSHLPNSVQRQNRRPDARPNKRTRQPRPVELPGSFVDTTEKQVAHSASYNSLATIRSASVACSGVDSAIELPTEHNTTKRDIESKSITAELEGSQVSTSPPVELPAWEPPNTHTGPCPPCELPGSFVYTEYKKPVLDLPISRKSHIIDQKLPPLQQINLSEFY